MPIYNSLIRNTVLIVQHLYKAEHSQRNAQPGIISRALYLQNLSEGFDDARFFITIYLYSVDKSNLGLGTVTERLENVGKVLAKRTISPMQVAV